MTDINTPDATLLESTALLQYGSHRGDVVQYVLGETDETPEAFVASAAISTAAWLEMGRPDIVTASIQPGDALNGRRRRRATPSTFGRVLARCAGYSVGVLVTAAIVGACVAGVVGIVRLLAAFLNA